MRYAQHKRTTETGGIVAAAVASGFPSFSLTLLLLRTYVHVVWLCVLYYCTHSIRRRRRLASLHVQGNVAAAAARGKEEKRGEAGEIEHLTLTLWEDGYFFSLEMRVCGLVVCECA